MNQDKIRQFTDLFAWQEAHKLVLLVYEVTKTFPKEELFGLTNQIRRAVISITSNIAEGFGRRTYKDQIKFYYMAQGSLAEVKNQLIAARDIGYLKINDYNKIFDQACSAHELLGGLIKKSKTF